MFRGDLSFAETHLLPNICLLIAFLTCVLCIAQEDTIVIPILDIIQSLFCWPAMGEGLIITICLWCFRHIERILGTKTFSIYVALNFFVSLPFYIFVIMRKGFVSHFSLFYFLPYGLFIFSIWRLPAINVAGKLSDKVIMVFFLGWLIYHGFPYSFGCLLSAIISYIIWHLFEGHKTTALLTQSENDNLEMQELNHPTLLPDA